MALSATAFPSVRDYELAKAHLAAPILAGLLQVEPRPISDQRAAELVREAARLAYRLMMEV